MPRPAAAPDIAVLDRREQILDETIRLIGSRGYRGLRVLDVATSCGLSNAGVLYYFPSKDHLLAGVMERVDQRETSLIAPAAKHALTSHRNSVEATLAILRTIISSATRTPEIVRLTLVLRAEALDPDHPAHKVFAARDKAALQLFARMFAPHVKDGAKTARQVLALMDGFGEHWVRTDQGFDLTRECLDAIRLLLNADAAKKPARAKARR